ncbi:50S ribosomal protein L13 [Atlantibacter subterranea]|uniref:50S ribosomal protein L13 n=1 Tax=Atlantibacter subterraneus TaxID=255519 RepID=A0A427UVF0_9ENTR|nr:50S ribosomal protein L13 [Atlantibacter subterranea]RSE04648.1 50S ribosomal protein L13 [Atlantibacter subterranea]RSE24465.1 50S ribosomal protein L13 [Atlantibacter subterranea]
MTWVSASACLPRTFVRVWVKTDTGRETTGYVNSSGEWVINCPSIRATGAVVVEWRE